MTYKFDLKSDDGKWTVEVDTAARYGSFERNRDGTGGGLWFQVSDCSVPTLGHRKLELIDYDGVVELPRPVIIVLRSWGLIVGEDFE